MVAPADSSANPSPSPVRLQSFKPNMLPMPVPASVDQVLSEAGKPLSPAVRRDMEKRFGHDFSAVRVHVGATAERSARDVEAYAYTVGHDLVFGPGRFAPETREGRRLLAHELTHVIQQRGSTLMRPRRSDPRSGDPAVPGGTGVTISGVSPLLRSVTPTPVARRNRLSLIGDGTAANPGITIGELTGYVATQADWFAEPTLSSADRDMVWNMLRDLDTNPALRSAARNLRLADVAALSPADRALIGVFATGFDPAAQTIRLSTPAADVAEAKEKGTAMRDLAVFVPAPVMRVVIPESGLAFLVTHHKVSELRTYYTLFSPTLEHPAEWPHVESLLTATVAPRSVLRDWIADLHIFSAATLDQLVTNVADFSRSRPVLLILFSATDWNSAFLQSANMEAAVLNAHNLGLVIQGTPNLGALTTKVTDVANRYGQQEVIGIDPWSFSLRRGPGRLGQVVIAGHGSETSVEMAISGAAPINSGDQNVSYSGESIDSATNTAHTQALIDTLLLRMDPAAARIVFAGCLVGSHEFPASMNLSNVATAATTLRAHLATNANLRDFVQSRMVALGVTGDVQAARGSTPFSTFNVTSAGTAQLSLTWDPAIGGSPEAYVQNGAEPEGSLRAALETYADSRFGPTTTTGWMRARVTSLAGERHWYKTQTRSAFQLALPPTGDANPATILDLSHRVEPWLLAGWASTVDVGGLAGAVHAGEQATVFGGMLASDRASEAHLPVSVQEAWMSSDASHAPPFVAALDASPLERTGFLPLLNRSIVDPKLPTLLSISGAPTRGQTVLALTISVEDGPAMPIEVRNFLRTAAGGAPPASFPAVLNVTSLIDGADELTVLQDIGLAPGMPASPASSTSAPTPSRANIDLDRDSTNERFVTIGRRTASVTASLLNIRARPSLGASIIGRLAQGTDVRVMGHMGSWSLIDAGGRVGFVSTSYLTP